MHIFSRATVLMVIGLLASGQGPSFAAPPEVDLKAPRDWSAMLMRDVQYFHDFITENHPGIYDKRNPGFRDIVNSGLEQAQKRVEQTQDAGGWWWALKEYAARFNDGHLHVDLLTEQFDLPTRWPGFLTHYQGPDQFVGLLGKRDPSLPPVGAQLIACDGIAAEELARQHVAAFEGLWSLEAQRNEVGPQLFMDLSNPWIARPKSCDFQVEGKDRTYPLTWSEIPYTDLQKKSQILEQYVRPPYGMKQLEDGGYWLSMTSFSGKAGTEPYEKLTDMVADAKRKQADLRRAQYIVLDVRGNGGGSSNWSKELAETFWGKKWIRANPVPGDETVDWRASKGNTAALQGYVKQFQDADEGADLIAYVSKVADGMAKAEADGSPYWRENDPAGQAASDGDMPPKLVSGPVYVLTDFRCASSCLSAVDLWKALGATQIGRETYADTLYLEARLEDLPSGAARAGIPMKVYRDRARGSNEPQLPDHVFEGNMTDDGALKSWVQGLPRQR